MLYDNLNINPFEQRVGKRELHPYAPEEVFVDYQSAKTKQMEEFTYNFPVSKFKDNNGGTAIVVISNFGIPKFTKGTLHIPSMSMGYGVFSFKYKGKEKRCRIPLHCLMDYEDYEDYKNLHNPKNCNISFCYDIYNHLVINITKEVV